MARKWGSSETGKSISPFDIACQSRLHMTETRAHRILSPVFLRTRRQHKSWEPQGAWFSGTPTKQIRGTASLDIKVAIGESHIDHSSTTPGSEVDTAAAISTRPHIIGWALLSSNTDCWYFSRQTISPAGIRLQSDQGVRRRKGALVPHNQTPDQARGAGNGPY